MSGKYYFKDIDIYNIIQPGNTDVGGNEFIGFPLTTTTFYLLEQPLPLAYTKSDANSDLSYLSSAALQRYNNNQPIDLQNSTPQKISTAIIPSGAKRISTICVGGGGGGGHGGSGQSNIAGTFKGGKGGDGGDGNYSAVYHYGISSNSIIKVYSGGSGPQGVNKGDNGLDGTPSKVFIGDNQNSGETQICLAPQGNGGDIGNNANSNSSGKAGKAGTNSPGYYVGTGTDTALSPYPSQNIYPPQDPSYGIGGIGGDGGNKSNGDQGTAGTSGYVVIYYYFD
jgi:hypothetical protein